MTKSKLPKNHPENPSQTSTPAAPPASEPVLAQSPAPPEGDPRDREFADLKDKFLRLQADFENYRKRLLRERQEMAHQALADFMIELLPVLDNLTRGQEVAAQHHADQAICDGFAKIIAQLKGILAKFGLIPIENTVGKPFDPNTAEAVSFLPSPDQPEGIVLTETRCGYRLHGRLLRPAQVVVSSGPAQPVREAEGTSETPAEE